MTSKVYGADVHERLAEAFEVTLDQAIAARRWRAGVRHAADRLFEEVDLLLVTPSVGAMHKEIGVDQIDLDGTATFYRPVFSWFSALVNHLGLPALSRPDWQARAHRRPRFSSSVPPGRKNVCSSWAPDWNWPGSPAFDPPPGESFRPNTVDSEWPTRMMSSTRPAHYPVGGLCHISWWNHTTDVKELPRAD